MVENFIAVVDLVGEVRGSTGVALLKDILIGFEYPTSAVVLLQPTSWQRDVAAAELAGIVDRSNSLMLFGSRPASLMLADPLPSIRGKEFKTRSGHRLMATYNLEGVAKQPSFRDQLEQDLAYFLTP